MAENHRNSPQKRRKTQQLTELGQRLERHRIGAGLTKADVARKMNTSRSTWDRMITGAHKPGVEVVLKGARAVGVPINEALRLAGYDPRLVQLTREDAGFRLAS